MHGNNLSSISHAELRLPPCASHSDLAAPRTCLQPRPCNTVLKQSIPTRTHSRRHPQPLQLRRVNVRPGTWNTDSVQAAAANTSQASTVTEDVEKVTITPDEHWKWHTNHVRHWHGQWAMWDPIASPHFQKMYRSIRSFAQEDEAVTKYVHKNTWYNATGDVDWRWDGGPWYISKEEHNLPDGVVHPQGPQQRVLHFTPQGDCAWCFLRIMPEDPKSVLFTEVFFMKGPDARFSVPFGYDAEGKLLVALMLEDAYPDAEKRDPDWMGDAWKHDTKDLDQDRDPPLGSFSGEEITISLKLEMTKKKGSWRGYFADLPSGEIGDYHLVHLSNNVTVAAPKKPPVEKGGKLIATWVASDSEIRQIYLTYGSDLNLATITGTKYYKTTS